MKHSTQELLLANAVMQRVFSLRTQAIKDMSPEERDAFLAKPANDLIVQALEEIERVADIIAKARPAGQS